MPLRWRRHKLQSETRVKFAAVMRATAYQTCDRAPDPAHAIIGLKNHGLTITGSDLDEIFERVEPHIQRHVPMS